jgi:hypothetical protein
MTRVAVCDLRLTRQIKKVVVAYLTGMSQHTPAISELEKSK